MTSRLHGFLSGVKVLDLSRHLPGPLATLLLADMGAEVTKIESPDGDELRFIGPKSPEGKPLFFEAINAGKQSIRIDLKTEAGKQRLRELAARSDVLVESFRPGVLERLGLGGDALRALNPGLVCVAMSGYGQDGPLRGAAGHDANYLAMNGILSSSGSAAQLAYMYPPMADCTASMFAVSSILGALVARGRDGHGCSIDLALADVMMPFHIFALAELGSTGRVPGAEMEFLNGGWACYRPYRTSDGRDIALGAIEPRFWRAFCAASNRPDWLPRHAEAMPQIDLIAEIEAHFLSTTADECVARYGAADCCFALVLNLKEAVESDHMRARGLVRRHPESQIYEAAYPVCIDGERPDLRRPFSEPSTSANNA